MRSSTCSTLQQHHCAVCVDIQATKKEKKKVKVKPTLPPPGGRLWLSSLIFSQWSAGFCHGIKPWISTCWFYLTDFSHLALIVTAVWRPCNVTALFNTLWLSALLALLPLKKLLISLWCSSHSFLLCSPPTAEGLFSSSSSPVPLFLHSPRG